MEWKRAGGINCRCVTSEAPPQYCVAFAAGRMQEQAAASKCEIAQKRIPPSAASDASAMQMPAYDFGSQAGEVKGKCHAKELLFRKFGKSLNLCKLILGN